MGAIRGEKASTAISSGQLSSITSPILVLKGLVLSQFSNLSAAHVYKKTQKTHKAKVFAKEVKPVHSEIRDEPFCFGEPRDEGCDGILMNHILLGCCSLLVLY